MILHQYTGRLMCVCYRRPVGRVPNIIGKTDAGKALRATIREIQRYFWNRSLAENKPVNLRPLLLVLEKIPDLPP
jgi:hypothetical protein